VVVVVSPGSSRLAISLQSSLDQYLGCGAVMLLDKSGLGN